MTYEVVAAADEIICETVEFKLSSQGWDVRPFENGRESWEHLEAASSNPLDAVVLDIVMPGLNGLQVLQRLRKDETLSSVPVLLLTSRGREEHVVEAFDRDAIDYLTKPFSPAELVAGIRGRLR